MTGGAPDFFDDEFAVIDVGALDAASENIDWPALTALLKSYRLNPVAVRNATPGMESAILAHGLSLDGSSKPRQEVRPEAVAEESVEEVIAEVSPEPAPPALDPAVPVSAMIVDMPVRAGQRIYARGCDLIIMAVVNNGAEVIADGSIHIYAQLRGRALAGASGNTNARIFAMSMEPELVSIAGIYRTFEDGFPPELKQQTAQIRLVGDRIDILPVQPAHPVPRT
jgi:septum site-determining protein MinC